ncbi:MAG TPA: hypothetical protein VND90_10270 [Terracidiphilus sp.]|nr:hypothetical protein [Terracidiphilus sp.]
MPIPLRFLRTSRVLSFALFILLAMPALAQLPKGDLFAGFSRTGNDTFYPNVGDLNGWEVSGYLKIHKPFLGVEADVAHYGLGANSAVPRTTTVLFGPRLTVGALGIHLFAHGLVGGEHSANSGGGVNISGGAFAYALGGGVDFPLVPFFAWRIQGDRISAPSIAPPGSTQARFSTGLVFRF